MKARRVLLTTAGPKNNVLKIKPPLVFSKANLDHLIKQLRAVLTEDVQSADMAALLRPWAAVVSTGAGIAKGGGPPQAQLTAAAKRPKLASTSDC